MSVILRGRMGAYSALEGKYSVIKMPCLICRTLVFVCFAVSLGVDCIMIPCTNN